jgi:hypothetical protein
LEGFCFGLAFSGERRESPGRGLGGLLLDCRDEAAWIDGKEVFKTGASEDIFQYSMVVVG